ncbi:hypothetical protein pipiens_017835, partial [Culex pipiens pipiens]
MMLGSENLLANFGTCLGIIEYRVQHANSLSNFLGDRCCAAIHLSGNGSRCTTTLHPSFLVDSMTFPASIQLGIQFMHAEQFTECRIGHARSNNKKMEQNIYKMAAIMRIVLAPGRFQVKLLTEETLHQRYPPGNSVLISLDANASGPLLTRKMTSPF